MVITTMMDISKQYADKSLNFRINRKGDVSIMMMLKDPKNTAPRWHWCRNGIFHWVI